MFAYRADIILQMQYKIGFSKRFRQKKEILILHLFTIFFSFPRFSRKKDLLMMTADSFSLIDLIYPVNRGKIQFFSPIARIFVSIFCVVYSESFFFLLSSKIIKNKFLKTFFFLPFAVS